MKAADTSLVVAAFASWHENHDGARRALDSGLRLIEHCAIEFYGDRGPQRASRCPFRAAHQSHSVIQVLERVAVLAFAVGSTSQLAKAVDFSASLRGQQATCGDRCGIER